MCGMTSNGANILDNALMLPLMYPQEHKKNSCCIMAAGARSSFAVRRVCFISVTTIPLAGRIARLWSNAVFRAVL